VQNATAHGMNNLSKPSVTVEHVDEASGNFSIFFYYPVTSGGRENYDSITISGLTAVRVSFAMRL